MTINRVALYIRLSDEDEDIDDSKIESNSVTNQRNMLRQYVREHSDFAGCEVVEFADDGFTGTSFARPEFNRMTKEILYGNIGCVIVKDFSRFGRNYIESGNYLERIFPMYQVRFISISDHFDSDDYKGVTGGINMAFKNFMHTMYSKDISQKVSTAMRIRSESGQSLAAFPAYGYKKNPKDVHNLIVDDEAASIVRMIFKMAADGTSKNIIAKFLNEKGVDTPVVYMNAHGIKKRANKDEGKKLWTQTTIADMLKNEIYLGKVIWNKTKRLEVGSRKQVKQPRDKWIIIDDVHEPIVSKELFDKANANAFTGKKRNYSSDIRPGIFICGSCGRRMAVNGSNKGYRCSQAAITGLDECQNVKRDKYILEAEVIATARDRAVEELDRLKKDKSRWNHESREWKGTEALKEKAEKLADKKMRLYDQYKSGKLKKPEYLELVNEVSGKLEDIRARLNEIHNKAMTAEYNLSASVEREAELQKVKSLSEYDTRILKHVIEEVVINPDGTHEYRWKKPAFMKF